MDKIEEVRYLIKAVDKEGENSYRQLLEPLNITPSQNEVLKILSKRPNLSLTEIGDLLICGSDNPSRVVQRLVFKKLIIKTTDPNDARRTLFVLTEAGEELLINTTIIESDFDKMIEETFPQNFDINQFISVLREQVQNTKSLEKISNKKILDELE